MFRFLHRFFVREPNLHNLKSGEAGEVWVAYLYRLRGHKILARNYELYGKKKLGEIDIVCQKGRRIIVVEVKTRQDEKFMSIVEAIDWRKQAYLRRMVKLYLQQNPIYENFDVQIDVAAVLLDPFDNRVKSVKLLENAIEDSQ